MFQLVSFCLSIAAVALMGAAAHAQSASTSVSASLPTDTSAQKKYSATVILSSSSDLEKSNNADHEASSSIEIKPSMRISSLSSLRANIAAERNEVTGDAELLNTQLVVARDAIKLTTDDDLNLSGQVILPTNEKARLDATLYGSVGAIAGVTHRFAILGKTSTFTYAANALKNVHQYERDNLRKANLSHRLRQVFGLDVNLTQKVSVSIGGYYQVGWTYENVVKEVFNSNQSIAYAIDDQYSVSLDHTTEGKMFAADGRDFNAELYDSRASQIGVSLSGTF